MDKKKILIIEDEPQHNQAYQVALKDKYLVEQTDTSGEGLSLSRSWHPDLIILDLMLPGSLNGHDILKELKNTSTTKDIKVIVVTNLENEEEASLSEGAEACLVKSNTSLNKIVSLIDQLLIKKEVL